jgi:hypothetical protein
MGKSLCQARFDRKQNLRYIGLWREDMLEPGTKIVMTKGYKGVKGMIAERTDSRFEFYIIKLDNGIHIVVGPSAFVREKDPKDTQA